MKERNQSLFDLVKACNFFLMYPTDIYTFFVLNLGFNIFYSITGLNLLKKNQ